MLLDRPLSEAGEHRSGELLGGRFTLLRPLGEGAVGIVWVARDETLATDVAVKVLRPELAKPETVERLAREAHTLAQLAHPAIVSGLDFGVSERGLPFLAMELLKGETLDELRATEGKLTPERASALLLPVLDGLGTAHAQGIVHRDIKPANIFLVDVGQGRVQPKVLDFGVAKLPAASKLTRVGAVLGSPQYLSPEQAEGLDDIDARADIWAIGVVLYELITGTLPFVADNYNALMRKVLKDDPQPTTALGVGDEQLWMVIERCLKKDPEERWASMWELGEALALWLFERGTRFDVTGRSLQKGWLEGTATGLQILLPSKPPQASLPPQQLLRRARQAAAATRPGPPPAAPAATPPRRWPILLTLAVAGLTAAALLTLRTGGQPPRASTPSRAEPVPALAVVPEVSPPPTSSAAASASSAVAPSASASTKPPARRVSATAAAPSQRPVKASAPSSPGKPHEDFGF